MKTILRKAVAIIPVFLLSCMFVQARYAWEYKTMGISGVMEIGLNLLPLYWFIIFDLLRRHQEAWLQVLLQASFYVYIFAVLNLTIYFVLFREISGSDWINNRLLRFNYGINLAPLAIFKHYNIFDRQVIGNLIMLVPLGVYLPLLYERFSSYKRVLWVGMLTSISIEIIQWLTGFRSADIDDVILNTIGVGIGFMIYSLIMSYIKKIWRKHSQKEKDISDIG